MKKALQYAVNPIDGITGILLFLDNFRVWIIKEADHYLNNSEENET
ncbi:hypothetical protein V7183_21965 [Bacillus sp. JJ1127]